MAYEGAVRSEKGSRVSWIMVKCHTKNEEFKSRDWKVMRLSTLKKGQTLWLIEVLQDL